MDGRGGRRAATVQRVNTGSQGMTTAAARQQTRNDMNEQNLIPVRTESEARTLGRAGGIASGIARRDRKMLRERLLLMGEQEITNKAGERGIAEDIIAMQLRNKAVGGDLKAMRLYAELTGQLIQKMEIAPVVPNVIRVPEDDEQ